MRCSEFVALFVVIILKCEAIPRGKIVPYVDSGSVESEIRNIDMVLQNQRQQNMRDEIKEKKKALEQKIKEKIQSIITLVEKLEQEKNQSMINKASEIMAIQQSNLVTAYLEKEAKDSNNQAFITKVRDIRQKSLELIQNGRFNYDHATFVSKLTALTQQALALSNKYKKDKLNGSQAYVGVCFFNSPKSHDSKILHCCFTKIIRKILGIFVTFDRLVLLID